MSNGLEHIEEEDELESEESGDLGDVSLHPANADDPAEVERSISADVRARYEVYSYRHAAALLKSTYPEHLAEIEAALLEFHISTKEIGTPGGNESQMPKKISKVLRPRGWREARIKADLHVSVQEYNEVFLPSGKAKKVLLQSDQGRKIENFIDGHKIDYVKGPVAFDMEWNSKDQTFDRDLYAFRTFHECGLISAGVMLTRSASLNDVFPKIPLLSKEGEVEYLKNGAIKSCRAKYGASTTWMGKLLYRLNAGRHGGCPILVFGITPKVIVDLKDV